MTTSSDTTIPETLTTGTALLSATGRQAWVVKTSKRTQYGEVLYWLRFPSGVRGHRVWTVKEMRHEGMRLG